jgi:pimeloyl-ACP methyl ester carboxylesterase
MANQIRMVEVPTLVVHGRRDRFFPVGNGEAIAREIPGARLLVLKEAAMLTLG